MKYILILMLAILAIGCNVSVIDTFPHPEDYPEIDATYINVYGDPDYIKTVTYDNGVKVTRAIWDATGSAKILTDGDVISASFVSSELVNYDYAQIGTEEEVVSSFTDIGIISDNAFSCEYNVDGVTPLYTTGPSIGTECTEDQFRVIDTDTIDYYGYDSINLTHTFLFLEHLVTLDDGTKMYGVITAIKFDYTTFATINISL